MAGQRGRLDPATAKDRGDAQSALLAAQAKLADVKAGPNKNDVASGQAALTSAAWHSRAAERGEFLLRLPTQWGIAAQFEHLAQIASRVSAVPERGIG